MSGDTPPLPTPGLPSFVDQASQEVLSSLESFSFGHSSSSSSKPVFPTSSFPAYCLPRKGSTPGWELDDLDDEDDLVNPSPVYGQLDADGNTLQTPGTPIWERPRFDYPDPASEQQNEQPGTANVAIRPSPIPAVGDRRGSISLPNVHTGSAHILSDGGRSGSPVASGSSSSSSTYLPLQPLHPASSPFAQPGSRRPSLVPAHSSSTILRSRSNSQHRSSFSLEPSSSRASMSHFHPPAAFSQGLKTEAPIPPSLRAHFANLPGASATSPVLPSSIFARRGSLPTNQYNSSTTARRQNSLSLSTNTNSGQSAGSADLMRRKSLTAATGLRAEEERRKSEVSRPRLGSIPSYASEDSGSGSSTSGRTELGETVDLTTVES